MSCWNYHCFWFQTNGVWGKERRFGLVFPDGMRKRRKYDAHFFKPPEAPCESIQRARVLRVRRGRGLQKGAGFEKTRSTLPTQVAGPTGGSFHSWCACARVRRGCTVAIYETQSGLWVEGSRDQGFLVAAWLPTPAPFTVQDSDSAAPLRTGAWEWLNGPRKRSGGSQVSPSLVGSGQWAVGTRGLGIGNHAWGRPCGTCSSPQLACSYPVSTLPSKVCAWEPEEGASWLEGWKRGLRK